MGSHPVCEPHNNQHAIRVLHAVLNTEIEEPFIPSKYFHEMKQSLEERVESLCRNRKNRLLPEPSPFFATPDMVIFQNFEVGKHYNATVTLQNKEQSSRCVKVILETNVHFQLAFPTKVNWTKVAPGMTYQVVVAFSGDELKDYQYHITFVTEHEQFSIPIYAFRPRPLIDFPDFIDLPDIPIHMTSEKNIIICNHGSTVGTFTIIATDPCCVCPSKAVLNPKEKMFLKISLKTATLGTIESTIFVKFDDDVKLQIKVKCKTVSSTIRFQHTSISFEDTFIGLQRQVPLFVEYHAIGHGYFKWKLYKTPEMDKEKKHQLTAAFKEIRDCETLKCKPLARKSIVDYDEHAMVYQRIFDDEVDELEQNEAFLFQNSAFTIFPPSGEMGSNGFLEFNVVFSPPCAEWYDTVAYLEVAGKEERMPLKLQGSGLGPQFKLNVAHLEANNVFLRSVHDYEIVAANTGHIPGTLTFHEKSLEFGGQIRCDPETISVDPEHYAAFVVSFTPGEEGRFIETVEFVIEESKETIHFIITGNVIAPLLSLQVKEIDFGVVALGSKHFKEIVLCNNSPVPIQYHIQIIDDGQQRPVTCDMFLENSEVRFPRYPQEYFFHPEEGVVAHDSEVVGMLELLPNIRRQLKTRFVVHMWGSKNYCISIPLKHDCRVADVVAIPPKLDIKFCFINYVYDRKMVLKNMSDLPCHFKFIPGSDGISVISCEDKTICIQKDDGLMVEVTVQQNNIPPLGEVTVSLKIQTPFLGAQEMPLYFDVFGKGPEMLVQVLCNGQGPAISFIPAKLNFGKVVLLNKVTQELEIINDTPIPAVIDFYFKSPSPFSLDETKKMLPPSSKMKIEVRVYLADPGKNTQVLLAKVESGQEVPVLLTAYGEGTSISCNPKLEPRFELGTLLTFKKFSFPILLRNEGSRWHKLWFSRSEDYKTAKNSTTSSANFSSLFNIVPNYFHLMPKESVEIQISASRKEQGSVCERFYCHAVIEKSHKTHIILTFDIVGKFLDPYVELSKSELNFKIDVSSDGVYASLRDKIKIRNECGLGLEIELVTAAPFYIIVDDQAVSLLYLKLNNLSYRTVFVEFQPPPHHKRCVSYSQTFYVNYKDHPKVDNIPVRGDINYPTLSINPQMVDFGCVPIGSSAYRAIMLNNISSLPVIFKWVWVDDFVEIKNSLAVVRTSGTDSPVETTELEKSCSHKSLTETISEESCMFEDDVRNILNSLVGLTEEDEEEQEFIRFLPPASFHSQRSDVFDIIPHEACIEPDESILTFIRFTPNANTDVSATVCSHIVGGGNELMTLTAKCKPISYYLTSFHVYFGKIYFYEVNENETSVVNDCDSKITFVLSEARLPNGWLTIEPSTEKIFPGESFPLSLKCFPGAVGRFETTFDIEVGYLERETITVSGFGVYPQIYFAMPRPNLAQVDPNITYAAVAELGNEVFPCQCAQEYFAETDRRILEENDWVVVSLSDGCPCTMEIDLSIERLCARGILSGQPNIMERLASGEKIWPIPNFVVPPYLYHLGCVQIETKQKYTLTFYNYGPGKTVVKAQTSLNFTDNGFELSFGKRIIDLNKTNELFFTFSPTVAKFPELNTKITEFIYIDVRNGARIPIQIDALVATPIVSVSAEEIDFGSIRCGDCLRQSINIINTGYLSSKWKATIEESLKSKSKVKPSFFLIYQSGVLEPGEKFYLRVYFEPHYDDFLNAELIITVDGNDRDTVVQLKGFGMEPYLEIFEDKITFDPNIPYSCSEKFVTIRNASKFPVEYFFPDFDSKVIQDESFVRAYIIGHMINRVYFPYRAPGEPLPSMFQIYYDWLFQEMADKVSVKRHMSLDPHIVRSKVKVASPKRRSRQLSVTSWFSPRSQKALSSIDEKDSLIHAFLMRRLKKLGPSTITLPKVQIADAEPQYEDPARNGTLIVFHGAPLSDYLRAANETGKSVNMPVYTIDRLIIDCLVENSSEVATDINLLINCAFDEVAQDFEHESVVEEDAFDVIYKKIRILEEGRPKIKKPKETKPKSKKKEGSGKNSKSSKSSSKKSSKSEKSKSSKSGKKSSKGSSKSGKGKKKKQVITDTLLDIPQSMLCELMAESLRKFPNGVIIESLNSVFIRKIMVALQSVLQISGGMDDVYFVFYSYTFDKYMEEEEAKEKQKEKTTFELLDKITASIDFMDGKEFAEFKEDYRDVYKAYIQHRKQLIVKRKQLVKERKLQAALKAKLEKEPEALKSKTKIQTRDSSKSSKKSKKSKKDSSKGSTKSKKSKESKKSKGSSKKSSKKSGSSKKSSKKSAKGKEKKKRKLTPKQAEIKGSLDTFERTLLEIVHTLEFWDRKSCTLTKPFPKVDRQSKKQKKSIKSARSAVTSTQSFTMGRPSQLRTGDIGIPCWIINSSESTEMLTPVFMKATVDAQMSHQQQIINNFIEPSFLQSVLRIPKVRTIKKSDIFTIYRHFEDTAELTLTKSKTNHEFKSSMSTDFKKSNRIDSTATEDREIFTYRKLLQPGEIVKYKVNFLPRVVGNYKHQFEIGIIGSPVKFGVTCIAVCDMPRIDMSSLALFNRVIDCRTERNKYVRGIFVEDRQKYEFGGILLPNPGTETTFESTACFHLNNISRITCDVSISLENQCTAFNFETKSHIIEPRCRAEQMLVAAPLEEQLYDDSLILSIKNNPEIEKIKLSCYGCEIGVDVNPKHVVFERVTLEVSLAKNIIITNNTPVEVTWRFVNCNEVLENFSIRSFGGRIPPFSFDTSTVAFTAKEMNSITSTFQVTIYDTQSRLVYATDIMVTVETTYLEFTYNNEIDFGDVKGSNTHSRTFHIHSKGCYEIHCQFSEIVEENSEYQVYRKYFKLEPTEGKIHPEVKYETTIKFSPDKVMTLEKLPVFKGSLIDPFHQVTIKSFDIYISARVFLSKFEICPYPEICYGYQMVGMDRVYTFEIINKGKFDFNYMIKHCLKEGENEAKTKKKGKNKKKSSSKTKSKSSKGSKKSKESSKSKGSKSSKKSKASKKSKKTKSTKESTKKKAKQTILNFGIFSLSSSTGVVAPNDREIIEVRSKPTQSGEFQETLIVTVSEPSHHDRNGRLLKVQSIACEPKLNFDEVANIFKEQHIVEKMDDFLASNIDAKVTFARSEKKLKFNKVCVNTTEVTRIRIRNVGHVAGPVSASFSTSDHIFTVSPKQFSIDPYQSEIVMIIYTPPSLDEHRSTLTLECRGYHTVETLVIEVIGESCVPEIAILQPVPDETESYRAEFPPTLIGNSATTHVAFQNIGSITCKVILEICFDEYDQLALIPTEETVPYLNLWDPNIPMKHTNLVSLDCQATAEFVIKFEPSRIGLWRPELKIHIVNNPFETKTINIFCEGYYVDVILEGLPCYTRNTAPQPLEDSVLAYSLNYGHVSLNTLEKKCFLIKNNSHVNTYKFEFPSYNEVIFSPSVGHIRPSSNKQVVAIFLSRSPVDLYEAKIECKIFRIEPIELQPGLLSWDDRQHFVVWCPETVESVKNLETGSTVSYREESHTGSIDENALNMKKIEENPEPEVSVVPYSSQNVAIFITIVAAYASYDLDSYELLIEDTFVKNKKSASFVVTNTGKVNLKMNWNVTMKDLPRRINSCRCMNMSDRTFQPILDHNKATTLSGREHFLFEEQIPRASSASTLFSCDTLETNRSRDSWTDVLSLPFTIEPPKALIEPNSQQTFVVTFAPVDVFDYVVQLKSFVENKSPEERESEVEVRARSILPVYCFELEPSDYVETRRRGKQLCKELFDENTNVVEFETIGLGIICTKKFLLKNPTREEFMYSWQSTQNIEPHLSCFHCHTPTGIVSRGETVEIVFSFIPQDCGIFEEYYIFNIPLRDIKVTFLLVGTAREPRIHFDQSHADLAPTIVGIPIIHKVILKNEENERYDFKFGKLPLLAEGITIEPTSGILDAEESCPIEIQYRPKKKGSADFDIKCHVQKIKAPLELGVSCSCFEIEVSAIYIDHYGQEIHLDRKKVNVVNLGAMVPNQKYDVPITVSNIGKTGFQWYWDMRIDKISGLFDILTESSDEILRPKETLKTRLVVVPLIPTRMWPHKIYFKIPYGPCYALQLSGTVGRPPFKYSFTSHDFGSCLVQTSASKYYKTVLKVSNFNIFPMTLEKGKHEPHISTDFQAGDVPPRSFLNITVYFHPFILGKHNLELPLYIDGKKTHVTILGKAVPLKLTLLDQSNKFIDLGPVLVGKTCTKTVRVLNESECSVTMFLDFWERLPKVPRKDLPEDSIEVPLEKPKTPKESKKGKKDDKKKKGGKDKSKQSKSSKQSSKKGSKKSATKADKKSDKSKVSKKSDKSKGSKKSGKSKGSKKSGKSKGSKKSEPQPTELPPPPIVPKQGLDYMNVSPGKWQKVASQRVTEFTVTYTPQERVGPFVEKIYYQIQNCVDALCIVKGSATAPDISLDKSHLTFGNVVVNFERMIDVVLKNSGDVPLKFKWLLEKKEEHFSISPNKGYILPQTDLIFQVFFRPKTIKCWIKSKVICHIPSMNKQLGLALSGSCIAVPPPKATITFSCPVRTSDMKCITILNPSNRTWIVTPQISGDSSFRTLEIARIASKTEDKLEVHFEPMSMEDHNATLCLPTPDGLITSYTLKGIATPPIAEKIVRDVLCKVQHLEKLRVKNWLLVKQQFMVTTTITGNVTTKNLFSVGGNGLIDVPPNSSRVYDWFITPINEGPLDLNVIFTNKTTKEYQYYEISLNVLPNEELDVIEFSTCARNPVTKIIKLENPLNIPVEYNMLCSQDNLEFTKTVSLVPHSVHYLEVTYTPLHKEEETKPFQATCKEMGTFNYTFSLTARSPVPESPIMFKSHLGQTLIQNVDIIETKTCQFTFEDPVFSLHSVFGPNTLRIIFEPDQIGRFQSQLFIKSPLGDFIYPLIGESCPPKPQGPFSLSHSSPAVINFKNPFSEDKDFYLRTEPSEFSLKEQTITVGSKKLYKVVVNLLKNRNTNEAKYVVTGKLTITCKSPETCWVYYLQESVE